MSKSSDNKDPEKNLSGDDRALFRDQTSDATPYPHADEPPPKPKRTPHKPQQTHSLNIDADTSIDPWPLGHGAHPELSANDHIDWSRHGLSPRAKQSLRKKITTHIQKCDLHGLNIREASIKVDGFLSQAFANSWRSVMIIHGKGAAQTPVLKNWLLPFLQSIPGVQAIVSAHTKSGGTGAVMVQLKTRSKP